jgi:G3E family GTPase
LHLGVFGKKKKSTKGNHFSYKRKDEKALDEKEAQHSYQEPRAMQPDSFNTWLFLLPTR